MPVKGTIHPTALIADTAVIGSNVTIGPGVVLQDDVVVEDGCYIDCGAILRAHVHLGADSYIGAQCILGELLYDFFEDRCPKAHPLYIGAHALIRSGSILYGGSQIGAHFQTGHRVVIRENNAIGDHVSLGTQSEIQDQCLIGDYVRIHSKVFMGEKTTIGDFVWIFPNVTFTNDPTPPSPVLKGVTVDTFAVVCAKSVLLPGVHVGKDALVAAGTVVTKDVPEKMVIKGNPGRVSGPVTDIRNDQGEQVYPWRYTFGRGMPWQENGYEQYRKENSCTADDKM